MPVTSKWLYEYYAPTHNVLWREIDMPLLLKHHEARDMAYGVDRELLDLRV